MSTPSDADIRERYGRQGYFIFPRPVLDPGLTRRACIGMDMIRRGEYDLDDLEPRKSVWNPGDDPNVLCKIEQPQFINRAIREVAASPVIGRLAAAATGAKMIQTWWIQLLYKPPTPGDETSPTRVGWHQDWNYWRPAWEEGSELLTAWVALSDVRKDSGPMKFVSGSHRWGYVEGSDFFSQGGTRQNIQVPPGEHWKEADALMEAGGFSLHDRLVLHGSDRNREDGPRRSLAIHLRTENSRPAGGKREGLTTYLDNPSVSPVIFGGN